MGERRSNLIDSAQQLQRGDEEVTASLVIEAHQLERSVVVARPSQGFALFESEYGLLVTKDDPESVPRLSIDVVVSWPAQFAWDSGERVENSVRPAVGTVDVARLDVDGVYGLHGR